MMNSSVAARRTVKSHWMPPESSSICVYVSDPTGLSTLFEQIQFNAASASGPFNANLANDV